MKIDVRKVNDVFVVKLLEHRLDSSILSEFKETMSQFLSRKDEKILLNLSHVIFIDESGIEALSHYMEAFKENHHFVICGLTASVRAIFSLHHLEKDVFIFDFEDGALEVLSPTNTEAEETLRKRLKAQLGRLLTFFKREDDFPAI